MQEKNPTLRAIKDYLGPDASMKNAPWQRRVDAGDVQAIKKAGEDARGIYEKREEFVSSDPTLLPQKP